MIMKTLFKVLSELSLSVCLLCALAFFLSACGDNANVSEKNEETPEIIVPEERQPFAVTNLLGALSYNEYEKEWIISPKREQSGMFIQLGDDEGVYMIVSGMKKEYESYTGSVSFSGKVTPKHNLLYNGGAVVHVYTVELTNLSLVEEGNK